MLQFGGGINDELSMDDALEVTEKAPPPGKSARPTIVCLAASNGSPSRTLVFLFHNFCVLVDVPLRNVNKTSTRNVKESLDERRQRIAQSCFGFELVTEESLVDTSGWDW